jgi:hypothetical protein
MLVGGMLTLSVRVPFGTCVTCLPGENILLATKIFPLPRGV